jgi:hypothetical protein
MVMVILWVICSRHCSKSVREDLAKDTQKGAVKTARHKKQEAPTMKKDILAKQRKNTLIRYPLCQVYSLQFI